MMRASSLLSRPTGTGSMEGICMAHQAELVYLYGIVPGDQTEQPDTLRGIDEGPVELHRIGGIAAVVGWVSEDTYSDEALDARLDDLAWVGARGLAHERVLDWFAERGPIIPSSLFSLHQGIDRLEARIRGEEDDFLRLLGRLSGRKEWGIRLWRREEEVREGIDELSPSLQALSQHMAEAPAGKRYLLERKRDAMRAEEIRAVSNRIALELFAKLRTAADDGVTIPVPSGTSGDRTPLLHAAYLVADDGFAAFQDAVTEEAARLVGSGFDIEFTGPWPPYNFTDPDDE